MILLVVGKSIPLFEIYPIRRDVFTTRSSNSMKSETSDLPFIPWEMLPADWLEGVA